VKRVVAALSAVFVLLFVGITVFKGRSSEATQTGSATQDVADREKITEFWQIYRRATQHRTAGNLEAAATEYGQALELNPDHEDALYYAGSTLFELGRFREAEEAWRHLIEVNPGANRGFSRLGDLYFCFEQADFFDLAAAQRMFQEAAELNVQETGPLLRLGEIALVRGDNDRAVESLNAVTAANFKSVPAYFFKGYLAWRDGDLVAAEQQFRRAVGYYHSTGQTQGVSSEGDTKGGKAILAETRQCQSFHKFAADLPDPDDPDLPQEMQQRYRELTAFLERDR
jgi:tetratricopeptide (TPR) repeat protein